MAEPRHDLDMLGPDLTRQLKRLRRGRGEIIFTGQQVERAFAGIKPAQAAVAKVAIDEIDARMRKD